MLFTLASLWLVADGAVVAVAGAEGSVVDAVDSPVAGLRPTSARLLRTLCIGPVLRARPFEGDTEPNTIHNILLLKLYSTYTSLERMVIGWLEFNGIVSTKRLYRALKKLNFVNGLSFI